MRDTMTRCLEAIRETAWSIGLRKIFEPLCDRYSSQPLTSAGLVVGTVSAATAKIGAADFYASVQGAVVKIAAGTAMPALTGINISAGDFNVVCFFVSSAGVVTAAAGTQGATLGAVVFPQMTKQNALIGTLIITYASAFTGGTTALSTATTVYANATGAFDPTVLI